MNAAPGPQQPDEVLVVGVEAMRGLLLAKAAMKKDPSDTNAKAAAAAHAETLLDLMDSAPSAQSVRDTEAGRR